MNLTVSQWLRFFPGTLGLLLSGLNSPSSIAWANSLSQYQPPSDFPVQPILQVEADESVGGTRTTPANEGARGPCEEGSMGLFTTLIPTVSETQSQQWALTSSTHPTLWFYVPEAHQINRATFSLRSADGEERFYTQTIKPGQPGTSIQPGIWSFTLPETEPGLVENTAYRAYLHLKVHPTANSLESNCSTFAFVQHKTLKIDASETGIEPQAALYAANGFWLDALNILGQAVCEGEDRTPWNSLLTHEHYPGFQPFDPTIVNSAMINCATTANSQSE